LVAVLGLVSGCGGEREPGTTDLKTLYAQEIKPPVHSEAEVGIDPDDIAASSTQFNSTIRFLGGNRYQLTITNGSDLGFLNSFTWVHPPQMTITAVNGSSAGRCRLVSGDIACTGMAIKPPKCSCLAGGHASVRFEGRIKVAPGETHGGVQGGWLRIGNVTPVPYTIPSFLGEAPVDLPICAKGQESTEDDPCVHSGG
jgi:hypothetical protein